MITLNDLTKRRHSLIVGPISLTFPEGKTTLVVGENSGGKSSLLKLIIGAISPDSGGIDGIKNKTIAYVPDAMPYPSLSTPFYMDDAFKEMIPTWDSELYKSLLKQYGIASDQKLGQLSKGNKKLYMFIVAEASHPDIVVMDEPTNGLDSLNLHRLNKFIELSQQRGCPVIIATNDIAPFETVADMCLFLQKGKVQLYEKVDTLLLQYRIWKGTLQEYDALDKEIVVSAQKKVKHIECLIESKHGEITTLETILVNMRRGIRL